MNLRKIKQWCKSIKDKRNAQKERKMQHTQQQRINNCCEIFQIMEFNGKMYISYDGVPVVRVDDLKPSVIKVLNQARQDYMDWDEKFNGI